MPVSLFIIHWYLKWSFSHTIWTSWDYRGITIIFKGAFSNIFRELSVFSIRTLYIFLNVCCWVSCPLTTSIKSVRKEQRASTYLIPRFLFIIAQTSKFPTIPRMPRVDSTVVIATAAESDMIAEHQRWWLQLEKNKIRVNGALQLINDLLLVNNLWLNTVNHLWLSLSNNTSVLCTSPLVFPRA